MPTHRFRLIAIAGAALGALLIAFTGSAAAKDSNRDRIPDKWEKHNNLSLKVKQTRRDQDRDGLNNRNEFRAGTDPRDRDSDNDGVMDGDENAGTIASFDPTTGVLTINVFQGQSVSGIVNADTEISCNNDDQGEDNDDQGETEDKDGGNSGPGGGDESTEGPGNAGDDDNNDEDEVPCTTADLVPGAVVHEAELELENGQAVFEEVELA